MPYTISTRPLTDEERTTLRQLSRFSLDNWAWVIVWAPSLGITGHLVGRAIEWGFAALGLVIAPIPSILFAGCGLILGAYLSVCFFRLFSGQVRAAKTDLRSGVLYVVSVQSDNVVQQKEYND